MLLSHSSAVPAPAAALQRESRLATQDLGPHPDPLRPDVRLRKTTRYVGGDALGWETLHELKVCLLPCFPSI